uniref:Cadmium resistance transporter n=1 Tax=Streptomyces sp. NBC_00049 TaxID=2903617 RepID=A0AAU2K063_9ACTN
MAAWSSRSATPAPAFKEPSLSEDRSAAPPGAARAVKNPFNNVAVFLVLVAVWCFAGRFFATCPLVAEALSRGGHVLLPVVLIAIGLLILGEGGAFGL